MEYERGRKDGVPSNVGPKPTFTGHAIWEEEVAEEHYHEAFEEE